MIGTGKDPNVAVHAWQKLDSHGLAVPRDEVAGGHHKIFRSKRSGELFSKDVAGASREDHIIGFPRGAIRLQPPTVLRSRDLNDPVAHDFCASIACAIKQKAIQDPSGENGDGLPKGKRDRTLTRAYQFTLPDPI